METIEQQWLVICRGLIIKFLAITANAAKLLASLVLLVSPVIAQAQDCSFTNSNGRVTITGYTGPGGDVTIPSTINGLPVVTIGDQAFKSRTNLTSVSIPNSVTVIGDSAFYQCVSLTNAIIPDSVISIGGLAFDGCASLASVAIPNSVTSLGDMVFQDCASLTNAAIGNGVTDVGVWAFYSCTNLQSITISSNVNSIGYEAFFGCINLTEVSFQGNAPNLDSDVFDGDSAAVVHYLPGTTGWGATFGGRPTITRGGFLQVWIQSAGALAVNAQWQVDKGSWQNSGATVAGLSKGRHTVAFKQINGWTKPATQTVTISGTETNTVTGIYLPALPSFIVALNAAPLAGGRVSGSGTILSGSSRVVRASANPGFAFVNWTEGGEVVSRLANYTFTVKTNRNLAANFTDVGKPTLTITAPRASQLVSNAQFVVVGKASDNLQVSQICCQLNSNSWVQGAGIIPNWSLPVTLVPGTNLIQAYAIDTTGNRSITNAIKVVYVLAAPLDVQVIGRGTVTPVCNNSFYQIGRQLQITATAATGFKFVNWTGSLTTTSPTLRFAMASNLTFTATFVDSARPVNVITYPAVNAKITNDLITVKGGAKDNVGVAAVWYQFNSTGWSQAATTNGWTNWAASPLTLLKGTNVIQAVAADAAQNLSLTNTVKFVHP